MKRRYVTLAVAVIIAAALVWQLSPRDRITGEAPAPLHAPAANPVDHGRALVVLADCQGCHTTRGGAPFAGGRGVPTPFGMFFTPNITPDAETGIGRWTAEDFWHALHNGKSADGTLLYPTFPYTNYTKISRRDADAMFAYLRTVPAVQQRNREHDLEFPYDQRWLLGAWRALYFRPGVYEPDARQSAEWNRGAYLVQGVAHCSACHEARNALGGIQSKDNPAGGVVLNWYAPSLTSSQEAGLHGWSNADIVQLLQTGMAGAQPPARRASTMGPMAEVVYNSLQYGSDAELNAMAAYLKSLPDTGPPSNPRGSRVPPSALPVIMDEGGRVYADHCAQCHGENGEGRAPAAPALAGNRALTMGSAVNPIRIVLYGGYTPATAGNPRPFGMPPFSQTLPSRDIATVLTYVRASWGNRAAAVSPDEVEANRTGPLW